MLRQLKVLLRRRKLFRNWLGLGIKYYLMRRGLMGFRDLIVRCRDGEATIKPEVYSTIVNAYHDGLIADVDCRGYVVSTTGVSIPISWFISGGLVYNINCASSLGLQFVGDYLVVNWRGHAVKFPPEAAPFIGDILCENMLGDAYGDLGVRDEVVVDVGAGVGDTAVMFALAGARKVIALEPYPSLFKVAKEVVELNGVGDRVVLLNAGLSSVDGFVKVGDCEVDYKLFNPVKCPGNTEVRIYTLDSLVREFSISDAVLKMDCEGCEYEAITGPEALKAFKQVVIEYHNGYKNLVNVLETAGFKTRIEPIKSAKVPIEKQGYIVGVM